MDIVYDQRLAQALPDGRGGDRKPKKKVPLLDRVAKNTLAFNAGCQARLLSKPLTANPYRSAHTEERESWKEGWNHTNDTWGKGAHWPVPPLPEVI
jgi:hypothetical protein